MSTRLGIGVPIVDSVPAEVYGSHLKLASEATQVVDEIRIITCVNIFPHDMARTVLMNMAFKAKCDLFLFLDADILVPTGALGKLLDVMRSQDACAVSGHYYRRGHPYTCVWSKKVSETVVLQTMATNGVHEISTSGLGFCLIDLKWVAENLVPPLFRYEVLPNGDRKWEDAFFFSKIQEKNGKVLGHGGVRCGHLGTRSVVCDVTQEKLRTESSQMVAQEVDSELSL